MLDISLHASLVMQGTVSALAATSENEFAARLVPFPQLLSLVLDVFSAPGSWITPTFPAPEMPKDLKV